MTSLTGPGNTNQAPFPQLDPWVRMLERYLVDLVVAPLAKLSVDLLSRVSFESVDTQVEVVDKLLRKKE